MWVVPTALGVYPVMVKPLYFGDQFVGKFADRQSRLKDTSNPDVKSPVGEQFKIHQSKQKHLGMSKRR